MKEKEKHLTVFVKCSLFSLIIISFISIVLQNCIEPIIVLSDTQILYIFSVEAQVVGGLFGLLLTAFIFFIDKFREEAEEDNSLVYDAIIRLKRKYYQNLKYILVIVFLSIVFCFAGIIIIEIHVSCLLSWIINESLIIGGISLLSIAVFAGTLLDPERKEHEMKRIVSEIREQNKLKTDSLKGSIDDFIRPYNRIERVCAKWADYCISKNALLESYRGKIFHGLTYNLRILNRSELLDLELQTELDRIRVYRNVIVHSSEILPISTEQCERLELIASVLEAEYDRFQREMDKTQDGNFYEIASQTRERIRKQLSSTANDR